MNAAGAIATVAGVRQLFNYDAYGNAVGFNPRAVATTLLYNGQQTDSATGLQYLRARYYNAGTGTFTTLDSYPGNRSNPLSSNKYLYTQADPSNGSDPSGHDLLSVAIAVTIGVTLSGLAGAAIGAVATIATNYALDIPLTQGIGLGMAIGGAAGIIAYLSPVLAAGIGIFGAAYGIALAIDTWRTPNTTWGQKLVASILALTGIYGAATSGQYLQAMRNVQVNGQPVNGAWLWRPQLIAARAAAAAELPPLTPAAVNDLVAGSGSRVQVVWTRITGAISAGRSLHTATDTDITSATAAAQQAGTTLYRGRIPALLWARLMADGEIAPAHLQMGGMRGVQYELLPKAVKLLLPYFEPVPDPPAQPGQPGGG